MAIQGLRCRCPEGLDRLSFYRGYFTGQVERTSLWESELNALRAKQEGRGESSKDMPG